MKKSTKIIIISLIAAIVIAAAAIVTVLVIRNHQNNSSVTASSDEERIAETNGDIVEFGSYPQSLVTDENLIDELNALDLNWVSYGYLQLIDPWEYVPDDSMRYADVVYQNNRYRAVIMDNECRPGGVSYTSNYSSGTVYWFCYEPLRWKAISDDGIYLCENLIDAQPFNEKIYYADTPGGQRTTYRGFGDKEQTFYACDYANSSIHEWLNTTFLETAFTPEERALIQSTPTINDGYYTSIGKAGYEALDSEVTEEQVSLLHYQDVLNDGYGFSTDADEHDDRAAVGTDYAIIQGLSVMDDENHASWLLRSSGEDSEMVCAVSRFGAVETDAATNDFTYGIRPSFVSHEDLSAVESRLTEENDNEAGSTTETVTTEKPAETQTAVPNTIGESNTTANPTTTKATTTQSTTQKPTTTRATTTQKPSTTQTTTKQETTKKVTLSSIRLSSYPTKRSYYIDESFDKSGAKVEASYSDGSTKDVTNQCTFTTKPFNTRGDYTVTVSYSENGDKKTLNFSVPVNEYTLKLDRTSLQIYKGESQQLTATTTPANKSVQWSSSDDSVVTVSGGKVSGKKVGTAVVTATIGSGAYKKTATCSVTVKKVEVTAVTVTPSAKTIKVGETFTLTKTVTPSNADSEDKKATWSSADKSIATVTVKDGTVTVKGIKAGSTTISAKVSNGKYGTCVVTVTDTGVTGVSVNPSTKTVSEGESFTITATISPSNASNKTLTWTSSDTGVATVKTNGTKATVTAVKGGTAKITATSVNGKQAVCTVTVKGATISVSPTSKTIYVGDTLKLTATISPSAASGQIIAWSSSSNSIATVSASSNGTTATVTGVKGSSNAVTITATLANGNKATCRVTVKGNDVSSISVGGTYKKSYVKGEPIDTSGMKLTVKYSNGKTETVTSGFTVSPTTATGSTIQVTYAGKTSSYSITLITPSITISTATSVYFGDENKITRKMTPDSGWSGGEYYTSSDNLEIPGDVVYAGFEAGSVSFYYQASYNGQTIKSNTVTVTIKKEKPVELHIENESYVYNTTYSSLTSSKIDVWGYFQNNQGIEKPVGDLPCKISKAGYNEDADAYVIRVYYTRDGYNILFSDIFYDSTSSKPTEIVYYNL